MVAQINSIGGTGYGRDAHTFVREPNHCHDGNTLSTDATRGHHGHTFDLAAWLTALSSIGGGFALMSGRKVAFMVADCDAEDLAIVMSHVVGHTDRQDAVKRAIEQRSLGQVA